ncbi:MAG TPA: hypothetical protein VKD71_03145 [Gemmataceae bacterium]|nr:hypothetical protein [Gemmataceae bacterium]
MAKRKAAQEPTGPGTFMILVLVFFVLASLILGVTTYLGFEGQGKLEDAAKEAKKKEDAAKTNADEQLARLEVNRIAIGSDTPQDRETLSGAARANAAAVLDEHKLIVDKLGQARLPGGRNEFTWPLMTDLEKGGDGSSKPAPAPNKTIPQIAITWAKMAQDMKTKYENEVAAHTKTMSDKIAADKRADDQKKTFDDDVAKLTEQIRKKISDMDLAFAALKTEADKKGLDFKKTMDEWAADKTKLEEVIRSRENELKVKAGLIERLRNPDASDLLVKLQNLRPEKLAEKMGTVQSKNGTFVNISFAARVSLVQGQTFIVMPPRGSLVEVIEKEKVLEKAHHEYKSYGTVRDPFTDNEFIKGMVEVTRVTGPNSAEARITYQVNEIRNPIAKDDQLFNMALSSGEREHVAYAGIIDLDGDGRPDNEQFVRILEANNLKVDAYLDLRTGEIKGAIDFKTKLLIIGSDAPIVGNVKVMMQQAKEKNVQLIDARMFLALIGIKPPKNPAPPAYSTVTLGGEGSKNVDPDAPMPPAAPKDEKKDEPKKDK